MHPALWKLYRLRMRGSIRSIVGKCKSLRGAALVLFTLLFFVMTLGPSLLMSFRLRRVEKMDGSADWLGEAIPVVMLFYVVMSIMTSLGERAIYFSPSDVDFLFPGPFSRRQILLYKILGNVTAAFYIAIIMPTSLARWIRSWPAAAVGFFLAFLAVNSITMCAQLVAQSVSERAFTRARKMLLYGLIAAAAVAMGQAASRGLEGRLPGMSGWQETLSGVRHSAVAEIVLAPFAVFARIIAAERLIPDALGWVTLGTIMIAGVYALAIRLDANYLETSVRVSQQIQERRSRAMRGGMMAAYSQRAVQSSRLPQPPWLGGVGPLVWRQVVQALRGGRGAMLLAVIAVLAIGGPVVFVARHSNTLPTLLPHIVIGVAAYAAILISAQAPLGFRGDYEQMELLKSLPIRPLAMACGETIAAAMILVLLEWLAFAATALFAPAAATELLVAGLFALPYNWIIFGVENFLFLLYPSPAIVVGTEGFLKMGRLMLFLLAKFLVLGAAAIVAAIPAAIAYSVTQSIPVACLVAWLALLFQALGLLLLVTWAFQRYDVSAGVSE
jgi:hypothetical protein